MLYSDLLIFIILAFIGWILDFIKTPVEYYKWRCLSLLIILQIIFSFLNIYIIPFPLNSNLYIIKYSIMFLVCFYCFICKISSTMPSDRINKRNVCIIFYRPKKIKQILLSLFGLSYSSAGLIIGNKLYQMRYESNKLQYRDYTNDYVYSRYLIIDTGLKVSELSKGWEKELLSQKARQPKTLFFRFNCLRSLRCILNQTQNYKYKGEIFPCLYLLRIKLSNFF